ncbi:hypothetical protein PENSPDRAFT_655153, partial [Peniophora sp. CONT]
MSLCVDSTEWVYRRWRIGSQDGYISAKDVILLGVVFVSPGRVMPLLQVRTDFGEYFPSVLKAL